jgi:hypothetical protein
MNDPLKALLAAGVVPLTPVPSNSRYASVGITRATGKDGQTHAYFLRRFVPAPERFATLRQYRLTAEERPDQISARALGDPEMWWRLADANGAVSPSDLRGPVGRLLRVTAQEDLPGPARE